MNEVVSIAQTNSGKRCMVMPGVRMFRIVTRKFIEPRIDDAPRMKTPTSHKLWPNGPRELSGGYEVQPASAAPVANLPGGSGKKKPESITNPAGRIIQNDSALILGNAMSRAPIIGGTK